MTYFKIFLFAVILLPTAKAQERYPQNYFEAPMNGEILLSGTFGELRGNHFHAGIDVKTFMKKGLPVLASASGYVSRIKVSPYGYGKALYIQHPNGYSSVYAHLQEFAPELENYLQKEQYRLRRNTLNLYPSAGAFTFKQGDTLAFSGNSGGSGAPHLHFEIRNPQGTVVNPLFFGFDIPDNRPPTMQELAAYTYQGQELMGLKTHRLVQIGKGKYRLAGESNLVFYGSPAFAIRAFDQLNGAPNPNGYYKAQLLINDSIAFDFRAQRFSFAETRYLNSHIDYAQYTCCDKKFARLFNLPHNNFSGYEQRNPLESFQWLTDSTYAIAIAIEDYAGNKSVLKFEARVKTATRNISTHKESQSVPYFDYSKKNSYRDEALELSLPQSALYESFYFETHQKQPCNQCLGVVYEIASRQIPLHRYYNLKLKLPPINNIAPEKIGIVELDEAGEVTDFIGGSVIGDQISAQLRSFGTFAIMADTLAPQVRALNFSPEKKLNVMDELYFEVKDELSGIENYEAYWNEKWMRLYYDYKNNRLTFKAADVFAESGSHTLTLKVWDARGNVTIKSFRVQW